MNDLYICPELILLKDELFNVKTGELIALSLKENIVLEKIDNNEAYDESYREVVNDLIKRKYISKGVYKPSYDGTGLLNLPSTSITNYTRMSDVDVIILGIPYDLGSVTYPGTRLGPELLRRNTLLLHWKINSSKITGYYSYEKEKYNIEQKKIIDLGNIGKPYDYAQSKTYSLESIEFYSEMINNHSAKPIFIGGDHSITYPILKGFEDEEDINVIIFDAHSDESDAISNDYEGLLHNNVVTYISKLDNIEKIYQLGLRDLHKSYQSKKVEIINENSIKTWIKNLDRDKKYYISIDIDILDPTIMPNTGSLLPSGWSLEYLQENIEILLKRLNIVGIDVVEFMPNSINDVNSSLIVSKLILDILRDYTREH